MIRTVLAFFGYVKIPKAAVQLSHTNEVYIQRALTMAEEYRLETFEELFTMLLKGQKTLTGFLRSGKLLS